MTRDRFFTFKDYDQIYYDSDITPEHLLVTAILATFVTDAHKIYNNAHKKKPKMVTKFQKHGELSAPTLSQFLSDLYGEACEMYCNNLNIEHKFFIRKIRLILTDELIEKG
jgi:hypothetical protein